MALNNARDTYTRRSEGVSVWVVRSDRIVASDPAETSAFFEPAEDKIYRHPTFYDIPDEVKDIAFTGAPSYYDQIWTSIQTVFFGFLIGSALAIPIGILSAIKQYSIFDHLFTILAYMGRSIPIFWFGLLLIILFSVNQYRAEQGLEPVLLGNP